MSMEALTGSVTSLVEDNCMLGSEMESEELLLRRLSPYATLRPGDLPMLLGISNGSRRPITSGARDHDPKLFTIFGRQDSGDDSDDEKAETFPERDVTVRGQDIGDLPAEYVVRGLRLHEKPVIGVYVDLSIAPGFRYRVRHCGTEQYLFDGRALTLQSVGLGYGKRLTFSGDYLNLNDNFFWSDSDPNGFAFMLEAVRPGDKLTIYGSNGCGVIGEVRVESVLGPQMELSTKVEKGDVIKRVRVTVECSVWYFQRQHHSMLSVKLCDVERFTGEATVIKRRGSKIASLDCIYNAQLACGPCTLQVE